MNHIDANAPVPPGIAPQSPLDVQKALEGKSLVLLGATGFLGKVWLSLLLFHYPGIGKIHMMVRPKKRLSCEERFWSEVVPSPVFDPIRKKIGDAGFEQLIREKVQPIPGDITEGFLGLDEGLRTELRGRVDVIVNVSGVVDFNPPLDNALKVNAFGAQNLIALARDLGDVPIMHTSTCFVVGLRNGVTPERNPLDFPFPRADELDPEHWDADREVAECIDLVEQAMRRVEDAPRQSHLLDQAKQRLKKRSEPMQGQALRDELDKVKRDFVRKILVDAGKERAQFWGWPNIYTYTKSIGEQVLMRSGLPVTIVRPAIVESAVRYPVPGWCEGISTSTPITYLVFKGHQNIPVDDHCHYDAIPVDMCSAGMIAALAALLQSRHKPVYQLCSSDINPMRTRRAGEFLGLAKRVHYKNEAKGNPLLNQIQAHLEPRVVTKNTYFRLSAPAVHRVTQKLSGLIEKAESTPFVNYTAPLQGRIDKASRQFYNISRVFEEFLPFIAGPDLRFSAKNTRTLMGHLVEADRERLWWAPESIDWRHYWMDIHIPGMKRWSFPLLEEKLKVRIKPLRRYDSLSVMLEDLGQRHEHSVALQSLVDQSMVSTTYGELLQLSDAIAANLRARGIAIGDRVALAGPNSPRWVAAYFGIIRAGGIAVPLDKEYTSEQFDNILRVSKSKLFIAAPSMPEVSAEICPRVDLDALDEQAQQSRRKPTPEQLNFVAHTPKGEDLASILYTSGTTGDPKGVMLQHQNFCALIAALGSIFPLNHRDRMLSVLPLHHTFEFSCGLLMPLSRGSRIVYIEQIDGKRISEGLSKGKVTTVVGVPALWELIERRITTQVAERGATAEFVFNTLLDFNRGVSKNLGMDLGRVLFAPIHQQMGGRLKTLISGAAALPPEVQKTFQGLGMPLAEGYGLTEAAPVLTVNKSGRSKSGHVGPSLPGVEIRIDKPNEDGIGEVLARGPNVMAGYAENEQATREVLEDEWLRTGDLGRLDKKGRLILAGRSKDVILGKSGKNVYPDDVEAQLATIAHIKELSVVGLADPKHGEIVACLATLDDEAAAHDRSELHQKAKQALSEAFEKLPRHSRPAFFQLIEYDLPRSSTRKVKRSEVQRILERLKGAQEAMSPEDKDSDKKNEIRSAIAAIAKLDARELRGSQDIVNDLGFDSLMVVELSSVLEDRFPGIDTETLHQARTVAAIEAVAKRLIAAPSTRGPSKSQRIEKDEDPGDILVPSALKKPVRGALGFAQHRIYETLFPSKVIGRAYIPQNRNCIVIANHSSHLDVGLIKYALGGYGKEIVSLAADDYFFKDRWRRAYFENFTNVARLDRKGGLRKALKQASEPIERGKTVILFPEGTRSPDGEIHTFTPLIGQLALTLQVDILPIYLDGAYQAFPKGSLTPKPGVKLEARIGPVLRHETLAALTEGKKRVDSFREVTRWAQQAVEALRDRDVLDLEAQLQRAQLALPAPTPLRDPLRDHHQSQETAPPNPAFTPKDGAPTAAAPNKMATPPPAAAASPMQKLMDHLQQGFVPGAAPKPLSFYISLGQASDQKWSIVVHEQHCEIQNGKPPQGKADCVLKTSPEMFRRIVRESYTPSFSEFVSGKVKTNDPSLLKVFKKVFAL